MLYTGCVLCVFIIFNYEHYDGCVSYLMIYLECVSAQSLLAILNKLDVTFLSIGQKVSLVCTVKTMMIKTMAYF